MANSPPRRMPWIANLVGAVTTVARGMGVTLRTLWSTYRNGRGAYTEAHAYPELPVHVAPRYRGYHRFDLTTCIACDKCATACPVDCIYIGKEREAGSKGFKVTGYTIDYSKCMFCALCVEPCPVDCIFMGSTLDLSSYSRDGAMVDFSRLPLETAWGKSTLNPTAVAASKSVTAPVDSGPFSPPPAKD
ncbi:MAG: 4Fe-4S binding protein [Planctomycetota bacterium]